MIGSSLSTAASGVRFLSVTFLQDVVLGAFKFAASRTVSLPENVARGMGRFVTINGPGNADDVPALGLNEVDTISIQQRMNNEVWVSADTTGTVGASAKIQEALDAVERMSPMGGVVWLPASQDGPATYLIDATIRQPDRVELRGVGINLVTLKPAASLPSGDSVIINKTRNTTTGDLVSPGLVLSGFTIDGSLRTFPAWLSKADGTPVTDPQADYRAGGCLAPTTAATGSASISGGALSSVTLDTPGAGYVYQPTVWVTGDGYGASVTATISGGVVTGLAVKDPGYGYTTCSLEIVGGGADPRTALYAADRRNPNYALNTGAVAYTKADRPLIQNVRFVNYGATTVTDLGCDGLVVERCEFIDCGQPDFVGNCLWSQSHGSPAAPQVYFRLSTNTRFRFNRVDRQKRSVVLFGGADQVAHDNTINGWGESAFFFTSSVQRPSIRRNVARDGVLTDITCNFVESGWTEHSDVLDNTVIDVEGAFANLGGAGCLVRGNRHVATKPAGRGKTPFGPFSERIGFNAATAAVAGCNATTEIDSVSVLIRDIDGSPLNAPASAQILDHRLIDPAGYVRVAVQFAKGRSKSIGSVTISGVDMTKAPLSLLFDPGMADKCLNPDAQFRVCNNPGHASQGAVVQSALIAAGYSGVWKAAIGFRPRTVQVLARTNSGASAVGSVFFFCDDATKNPGTTGSSNTSGIGLRFYDNGSARGSASVRSGGVTITNASGTTVFQATAVGFNSDGWSMNVFNSTEDVYFDLIATP